MKRKLMLTIAYSALFVLAASGQDTRQTFAKFIEPNEGVRYMIRGFIRASLSELPAAYKDFDRAFQLNPNIKNVGWADPLIVDHYAEQGVQLASRGDLDGAIAELNKAIILAGQNKIKIAEYFLVVLGCPAAFAAGILGWNRRSLESK